MIKATLFVFVLSLVACKENYIPKPKGYFRIDLPATVSYDSLESNAPYSFEISEYAKVKWLKNNEKCDWLNITYPSIHATIHLSYQEVDNDLPDLINDAHTFVNKHAIKADNIPQKVYYYPEHKVAGVLFQLQGNTASPYQFFSTDSVKHFLRGALYFNSRANQDSLMPLIEFVENDIYQIIETLEWK